MPSFGPCRVAGIYLTDGGWHAVLPGAHGADLQSSVVPQLTALGRSGGPVTIDGQGWAWALPLRGHGGHGGYFVVAADEEPSAHQQFLLQALTQQTGVALANARLLAKERATAEDLRATNTKLAETVRALERTTQIHDRFTRVVVADEGLEGIATALHELTGFPIAVEDRYGNLRAWAGPHQPEPYPKDPRAHREQMLRRALREGRPIREGGRLLSVASPRVDVVGVLALVDPAATAGDQEQFALEYGATVLSMELMRLRSLAETELRLRRDLVEELLSGTDEASAIARANALGYDIERRHHVIVIEGRARAQDQDLFMHAVRRAARSMSVGSMLVSRGGTVVVLSDRVVPWESFRATVLTELGGGRCRIGVGGPCDRAAEFPRSYREATLALKMQQAARGTDQAIAYEDLGVYQLLGEVEDPAAIERLVQQWLGALLEYDARKNSELVSTLSHYLECGGSYNATATALCVHRSTLKYRLQRIREISGLDLTDPNTHFNLQLATRAWRTLQALRG
ncbi:helix-turn-helix domain-containing protein [Mycolicibacterium chubuense]|uniref:helix-turn-helix domain-containing protein n=1 Tax=Mycolicibacterium chubuense TaxID=1800 RepID=UPI001EF06006|nr:helix-turn-helix domain-containing protein [Mycolicibacterium chubuense]